MPTLNQKRVAEEVMGMVKRGENVSITRAMRKSKLYSEATSKHPEKITKSKGWKELMEQYLPESKLASVHNRLLSKKDDVGQPHSDVKGALDMGYKLHGLYEPEKHDITSPELIRELQEMKDMMAKLFENE